MAIKYKMLEKAAVGERFPLSWMVFDGWDFAITEAPTAKMKMKDITMSFKVRATCPPITGQLHVYTCTLLWITQETLEEVNHTTEEGLTRYVLHVCVWCVCGGEGESQNEGGNRY